jgi:hypothetical protein
MIEIIVQAVVLFATAAQVFFEDIWRLVIDRVIHIDVVVVALVIVLGQLDLAECATAAFLLIL